MKRMISLSIAALMTSQSVAFAQTDRTTALTNKVIAQTKSQLSALRINMYELDRALGETVNTIENRDSSGQVLNGLSIAGAGLGIGLTFAAYMTGRQKTDGAGLGLALLGLVAASVSTTSAFFGMGSLAQQEEIDTKRISEKLDTLQKEIGFNITGLTAEDGEALKILRKDITALRQVLSEYQNKEDSTDKAKVLSHIGQVVGMAMLVYSLTDNSGVAKYAPIGALMINIANVSRIVSGMTSSQAEQVIKEIKELRKAIQANAAALE